MSTTLPVPIEFRLPEGWLPAPPDAVNAPGVAFVALHPHPDAGFTANITIEGEFLSEAATLEGLADASVQNLHEVAESVVVAHRREIGSEASPGLTQRLTFSAVAGGARRDLVQSHVYLAMVDAKDPHKRAVIKMVLTATEAQHDSVLGDFQEFLRTVRPDTGTEEG
ncbi:hypothetical protein J7E99_28680 [Streptomyces sp. ISL-44]|uniref:hypothetical protein n=1 Tax=Streptomyces sp. ISL-44 TaxID=2819184 RepID=UPI001BE5D4F1|nr:hypothetical protein [Streptomyces sp. ISL-44]MBT2544569.1 hypothetical protein [Streptomyces sp. ISL-44]